MQTVFRSTFGAVVIIAFLHLTQVSSLAAFVAYNDQASGPDTHPNTTLYGADGVSSGLLKDIQSGQWTSVTLSTFQVGVSFESSTGVPAAGTDAANLFGGYVDFSTGHPHSLAVNGADTYTHRFSGLDPSRRYDFCGTAVRGGDAYADRWTLVTLNGAASFTPAHSAGLGVVTNGLAPNQVALWTGQNHKSDQGYVARWIDIEPGSDGVFEVVSSQYQGLTPGVGSGNSTGASKGYALNGIRLAETFIEGQARIMVDTATNLTASTATLRGQVVDPGQSNPIITIYYGLKDGDSVTNQWSLLVDLGPQSASFSTVLSQLQPGTRYFFRVYARNSAAQEWVGASQSFVTAVGLPSVRNLEPSAVEGSSARIGFEVLATGGEPPAVTLFYGKTDGGENPAGWSSRYEAGLQAGTATTLITGLEPNTRYYYRSYAANTAGGAWAESTASFVTKSISLPGVVNFAASNITQFSARAGGRVVETGGDAPRVTLFWGKKDGGAGLDWEHSLEAGIQDGAFSMVLTNLQENTTYYYRAKAQNQAGPGWASESIAFNTLPVLLPSLEQLPSGNLSDRSVLLRGRVLDTGGEIPVITLFFGKVDAGTSPAQWEQSLVLGPQSGSFSQLLQGLAPETQYYTRLLATNRAGAVWTAASVPFKTTAFRPLTLVINEIHYAPSNKTSFSEFVELYNASSNVVDLSQWAFTAGIQFTFPAGASLAPAQYLVIAQSTNAFRREFGFDPFGEWGAGQRLANEGDHVTLRDGGGQVVDEVEYGLAFPWPTRSGGDGASMELLNPVFDRQLGGSWRPSQGKPTPGKKNSVYRDNDLPALRQVKHSPKNPTSTKEVTISIKASDSDGLANLTLSYQVVRPGSYVALDDPAYSLNWTSMAMHDDGMAGDAVAGDGVYTAVLPRSIQSHRCLVRYRITATDTLGNTTTAPYPDDSQPNFAYFVYDGLPAWRASARPGVTPEDTYSPELLGRMPVYHLITTRAAHEQSQAIPNSTSGQYWGEEYPWKGALVYDGEVYDHIRFRARGGVWRYSMGKNMWKFDFNRGHDFHARDDYGDEYQTPWKKLNFSALIQQGNFGQRGEQGLFEAAGFRLHNLVGNPASLTHFLHFRIIEHENEQGPTASQFDDDFQGLYLAIEQPDGRFLDEHGLPDGNLYKMEGGTGELNNQGPTQPANKSDLNAFMVYQQGSRTTDWWRQNLDLEQYYNYRAILLAIHDYDDHAGKNYFYYNNPATGLWSVFNWDLDLTWTTTYDGGGGTDPLNNYVLALPELSRDFNNRMREIRDLLFNPEQTGMLLDEIARFIYTPGQLSMTDADRAMWDYNPIMSSGYVNSSKAGQGRFYQAVPERSFGGMLKAVKNYVGTRGSWMDANILKDEASVPRTPTVSYAGPAGFPVDQLQFNVSAFNSPAGAGFAALKWRLAWISDTNAPGFDPAARRHYEITPVWESPEITNLASSVRIPYEDLKTNRVYRVRARMKDTAGRWSHWSAPIQFTPAPPSTLLDYQQNLVITELMYHPLEKSLGENALSFSNSDFEFIEIYNRGDHILDLRPLRFTKGIDFDFTNAIPSSLPAGQYALIVRNRAAFESRYGSGLPVIGQYGGSADDKLGNDGEWLKLSFGAGIAIQEFTYLDQAPWPDKTDGEGYSLVRGNPGDSQADLNDPVHWTHSRLVGGSPGTAEPAGDSYEAWKMSYFNPSEPAYDSLSADAADPDQDGIPNIMEYVSGTDPRSAASVQAPLAALIEKDGNTYLALSYRHRLDLGNLTLVLQCSSNLADWARVDAPVVLSEAPDGENMVRVTLRYPEPISTTSAGFMRLCVQRVP